MIGELTHRFLSVFAFLGLLLMASCGSKPSQTSNTDPSPPSPAPNPPNTFEPNDGQTDKQVQFLAKVQGYNLYLTGTDMVFDVIVQEPSVDESLIIAPGAIVTRPGTSAAVKFSLIGANPYATAEGVNKQESVSNYFIGNDPAKWVTNVDQYSEVLVKNIYKGINMRFYGSGNVVEHDFIVDPGIDPSKIQMQVVGAYGLSLGNNRGDLEVILNSQGTKLTVKRPIAYQGSTYVDVTYKLTGNVLGFNVGSYDRTKQLIIDPVTLVYSGVLGGTLDDVGIAIALDSTSTGCSTSGSPCPVIVGYTKSTNFPSASAYQGTNGGGNFDGFIMRTTSTGGGPTYSTYFGGSGDDLVSAVKIDGSGNVYITGYTTSTNFPTTTGALQRCINAPSETFGTCTNPTGYDAFITKFTNTGDSLTYSTYFGTSGFDSGIGIALDTKSSGCTTPGSACAVIIGTSVSTSIATAGTANTTGDGTNGDAYVMRINSTGTTKTVATYLGGTGGRDSGFGIAIDPNDTTAKVFVTGETRSSTFVPTPGGVDTTLGGSRDAFVVKLDAALTTTGGYATYLGGSNNETPGGIALDTVSSGCTSTTGAVCAVIVGTTLSSDHSTANAHDASHNGGKDVVVSKLNSAGSDLTYSTYVGGSGDDEVVGLSSIAVDANGEAWFTGKTNSLAATFPILNANIATFPGSAATAFVAKIAGGTTSADLSFVTYHGGTASAKSDAGTAIAVDATASNCYVTGIGETTDFTIGGSPFDTTPNGAKDGFLAKFTTLPVTFVQTSTNTGVAITTFAAGTAIPTGTVAEDLMFMAILVSADDITISTPPSGWTLVSATNNPNPVNGSGNSRDANLYVYYKVATGTDTAPNVTFSASTSATAIIITLRNVNPTSIQDATGTVGSVPTSETSHSVPGITTTQYNSMIISFYGVSSNGSLSIAGMTQRASIIADPMGGNNDVVLAVATLSQASPGASGTKTATAGASGAGTYITFAVSER